MSGYCTMTGTEMWPQGLPYTAGLSKLQALEAPGEAVHRELLDPMSFIFPFKGLNT